MQGVVGPRGSLGNIGSNGDDGPDGDPGDLVSFDFFFYNRIPSFLMIQYLYFPFIIGYKRLFWKDG